MPAKSLDHKTIYEIAHPATQFLIKEDLQEEVSPLITMLRRSGKSNKEFETMVSNLSLEDLIALKLELSFRTIKRGLYGLPIWSAMVELIREAVMTAVLSRSKTKVEAARVLNMSYDTLIVCINRNLFRKVFAQKNSKYIHEKATETKTEVLFTGKEKENV